MAAEIDAGNVLATSHIPLSRILPYADLLIHHGGIGSTYAGFFSSTPALVMPHAFDQSFNAHLVERLGVGWTMDSDPLTWRSQIEKAIRNDDVRATANDLASRLAPPSEVSRKMAAKFVQCL